MKISTILLCLTIFLSFSCEKAKDRRCFKSYGDVIEVEVKIDSVQEFKLFKGVVYKFYQDTLRKVIIKGGTNVVGFIDVKQEDYIVSINNLNLCDLLRDYDDKITVEIHYPHYADIYAEPTEPIVFVDTLKGYSTHIELRNGGESLDLNVDVQKLYLDVTLGTGSINVYGKTSYLKLGTLNLGRINALGLIADDIFIYQNSSTDMTVNLNNANAKVHFSGNGDVRYIGVPSLLEITGESDGEVIMY